MTDGVRVTQGYAEVLGTPVHAGGPRVTQAWADALCTPAHAAALRVSQNFIEVLTPSVTVPLGVRVTEHYIEVLMSKTDVVSIAPGRRKEVITF